MWGLAWMMERVADARQKPPQLTYKAARYASRRLWFDCSKAHRELGMPRTSLRETVEKSIRWFRANGYA
jgi:dihydroflavonol-4-reductase